MTAFLKTSQSEPFAFDPSLNIDEALATIAEALEVNHVFDTTAGDLQAAGVNITALSQRVEQSDEFDVAGVATLINTGYAVDRLNEVLEGETPTDDVDTAIYHIARDCKLRLVA